MAGKEDVREISKTLHRLAHKLLEEAALRRDAGDLSGLEYARLYQNVFQPLNKQSADLLADDAIAKLDAIKPSLAKVTTATRSLDRTLRKIKQVEDIAAFGAQVVAAGAQIAAFVASPTLAAANATAINVRKAVDSAKRLT